MNDQPVHWLINARDQLLRFLINVQPGMDLPPGHLQATMDDLSARLRKLLKGHSGVTVLNQFTGYRSRPGEYILLVESIKEGRPVSQIVKFSQEDDGLRAEAKAYKAAVGRNDPVMMRAEFMESEGVFGLLYEDASQFIGGEVASLEQAFLGAVRFATPAPSSVLGVLKGLYDRLGFVLYQYAGAEDRARAGFRLAVPHFDESLAVWSGPRPEAPKARRDVNSSVNRGRGLFRDPADVLGYLRDRLREEKPLVPLELLVPWMMRGKSHGDLHGRNVKVGIWDGEACWPAVFDHEKMGFNNLVAWDFVKMETELKIRVYQHLFKRSPRYRFIGDVQKFELRLAEQTEKCAKEGGWPTASDDPTKPPLERLEALLMGLRRLAGKHLSQQGQRKGGWVGEWHFLLACYGVQTGRFNTEGHELEAAYVSAGVAMARHLWDREDRILKAVTGGKARPTLDDLKGWSLPCHEHAFHVAREWVKSPDRAEDAIELLKVLEKQHPHVVEIRSELALAHLRDGRPERADEILKEAMRVFEFQDEEMHARFGKLAKQEGHAALDEGRLPDAERDYQRSLMHYRAGYDMRQGHYPGVNAAALMLFFASARKKGGADPSAVLEEMGRHAVAVLAGAAGWPRSLPEDETVWHPASRGELLLLLKRWHEAEGAYARALRSASEPERKIILSQLRRLLQAWAALGEEGVPEALRARADAAG